MFQELLQSYLERFKPYYEIQFRLFFICFFCCFLVFSFSYCFLFVFLFMCVWDLSLSALTTPRRGKREKWTGERERVKQRERTEGQWRRTEIPRERKKQRLERRGETGSGVCDKGSLKMTFLFFMDFLSLALFLLIFGVGLALSFALLVCFFYLYGFSFFFCKINWGWHFVLFVRLVISPRGWLRRAPGSILGSEGLVNHATDILEGRKPVKRVG